VLKRIDALMQEIQQLKAQVKANEEKTAADMKALSASTAAQPVAQPVNQSAEGLSRDASQALAAAGEPDGIDLVKSAKANLKFYGMIDVGPKP
jgi:cell division septum initiation protein DivIVA